MPLPLLQCPPMPTTGLYEIPPACYFSRVKTDHWPVWNPTSLLFLSCENRPQSLGRYPILSLQFNLPTVCPAKSYHCPAFFAFPSPLINDFSRALRNYVNATLNDNLSSPESSESDVQCYLVRCDFIKLKSCYLTLISLFYCLHACFP
jgi:hypothetical protein